MYNKANGVKEEMRSNQFSYGVNALTKSSIKFDRTKYRIRDCIYLNQDVHVSYLQMFQEMVYILKNSNEDKLLIIDSHDIYSGFCLENGGELIEINEHSEFSINPFAISKGKAITNESIASCIKLTISILQALLNRMLSKEEQEFIEKVIEEQFQIYLSL